MAVYRSDQAQLTFVTEAAAGAYPEGASSVTAAVASVSTAPTAAPINSTTALAAGSYTWKATFMDSNGVESVGTNASTVLVVVAANGTITITPPVGPSDTASRRIYRTDKTNTGEYFYVTGGLITNNTASQTIVDSTADASLGIPIPSTSQLTVDTAAGATSIAVDANKNFSVGDLIQIGPVISASASTPTYGATYNITLNNESWD